MWLHDLTTVSDAIACHRVAGCTRCGGPLPLVEVASWRDGTVMATELLCQRCAADDP
jgi:hypothetical protein